MSAPAAPLRRKMIAGGGALLLLGLIMALLAYIPFMGLLAPSLAALAYLHFCLESLRRLRGDAVLSVSQDAR